MPWRRSRTRCGRSSRFEDRVRPYNKYLAWELRHHPLAGWTADELLPLLDRVLSGDPRPYASCSIGRAEGSPRRVRRGHRRLGAGRRVAPRQRRLPRPVKKRLDIILVERGLAESRAQAQALVLAGLVHGYDKPGHQVDEEVELLVERPPRYVSRGGEKLAHGLDALAVDPAGLDCVDVGASTGGFTDVLLERGAARVIASTSVTGSSTRVSAATRASPCSSGRTHGSSRSSRSRRSSQCATSRSSRFALRSRRSCASACRVGRRRARQAAVRGGPRGRREGRRRARRRGPPAGRPRGGRGGADWGAGVPGVVDSGLPGPKGNRESSSTSSIPRS